MGGTHPRETSPRRQSPTVSAPPLHSRQHSSDPFGSFFFSQKFYCTRNKKLQKRVNCRTQLWISIHSFLKTLILEGLTHISSVCNLGITFEWNGSGLARRKITRSALKVFGPEASGSVWRQAGVAGSWSLRLVDGNARRGKRQAECVKRVSSTTRKTPRDSKQFCQET